MDKRTQKKIAKLLHRLRGQVVTISINAHKEIILKSSRSGTTLAKTTQEQLSLMASRGLIKYNGSEIEVTDEASRFLTRQTDEGTSFVEQHYNLEKIETANNTIKTTLTRNVDESPLNGLYRRRTKTGAKFLSSEEFLAGERLRRDFTFGALMPSVTMRWVEKSEGKKRCTPGEINDETFAARQRVNNALKAVGPELGSMLIDVCCFLKGMETIEKERQWPVRSAKIVLKTALIALDRHYNPEQRSVPSQFGAIRSMEMFA